MQKCFPLVDFRPLNMLDSYANRYGYMFAFGVTVNSCFDVLFGNYIRVVGEMNANKLNALPAYFSGTVH